MSAHVTDARSVELKKFLNHVRKYCNIEADAAMKSYTVRAISIRDMSILQHKQQMHGQYQSAQSKGTVLKHQLSVLENESYEFQKSVEREFDHIIAQLVNANGMYGEVKVPTLKYERIAASLIRLVDPTDVTLSKDLTVVGLRLFRKMIERESHTNESAAEWSSETFSLHEEKITQRQTELCELGLVQMVCNHLSEARDVDIINEAILVAIALLVGGNVKVQQAFLEYMQEDMQNQFLLSLKALIHSEFEIVKKDMHKINEQINQKLLSSKLELEDDKLDDNSSKIGTLTNLQSMSSEQEIQKESQDSLQLLIRIYRLLQLFCEGHMLDMQKHLQKQTTLNRAVNAKTYDFITHSSILFGSYIKFFNKDAIEFGEQLLEFLIEAVQGPCEINQKVLVEAKIIDFCMDFAMKYNEPANLEPRGFNLTAQEDASDVITKALKLLNALIEGGTNTDIIEEMNNHLDLDFLIRKLTADYSTLKRKSTVNWKERH